MPNLPKELIYADCHHDLVPSLIEQTPFKAGFFRFGQFEQGRRLFNCALYRDWRGEWLIARVAEEDPRCRWGKNSLWAFHLDEKHNPIKGVKIGMRGYDRFQHWEDPRCTIMPDGLPLVSYTTFVMESETCWYGAHQQASALNEDFQPSAVYDPIYGKNGGSVLANGLEKDGRPRNEKNWLWFYHDGRAHCVYMTQPHEVVRFWDGLSEPERVYKTDGVSDRWWRFGHPRGGTPPVRIGDEYWSFFHSSTRWAESPTPGRNRYHMGAYAFEAKPPFKITRFSRYPILTGSPKDPWSPNQPLVIFPCGALLKDGTWLVSMGVNDMASAWIEIPHSDLEKLTPIYGEEACGQSETSVTEPEAGASPEPDAVAAEHETPVVGSSDAIQRGGPDTSGSPEGLQPQSPRPARRRIRRRRAKSVRGGDGVRASGASLGEVSGAVG